MYTHDRNMFLCGEDGNFEEDDEFADFERNDTVVFSFVRHNRYEADLRTLVRCGLELSPRRDFRRD